MMVYLSGPMTPKGGFLAEENAVAGLRVHLELVKRGIPNFCPQLSGAFPSAWTEVGYAQWLAFDLAFIAQCTHILMLPRWELSVGACMEKEHAEKLGKTVVFSLEELLEEIAACAT